MGRNRKNDDAISGVFKLNGENKEAFLDFKNELNKVSQTNNERTINKIIIAWRTAVAPALRGAKKP